ncbi:MAG: CBS domain-containing protein [Candidatus Dormibacteraeota bacterium]|nr:CBS domain-containing protein [Candidatus Dormibacteraeota bacterium]
MGTTFRGGLKPVVRDVMTQDVLSIGPNTGFKEMVRLIEEAGVGALPVVSESRRLEGIVSKTDLLLKEEGRPLEPVHHFERRARRLERSKADGSAAYQVMTSPTVTARPETTVQEAALLMHQKGVKQLPVVDADGSLLGIVTRSDLLRVFIREDETLRRQILEDLILKSLWMDPNDFSVEVSEGRVRLSGQVERRSTIPVLLLLIGSIPGVVSVEDVGLRSRFDLRRT